VTSFDPRTGLILLDKLLALAWSGLSGVKRRPRTVKAARRSEFVETMTRSVEGAVDQLRSEGSESDKRIAEYQLVLAQELRRKLEIETLLRAFLDSPRVSEAVASLPGQYRRIKAEPDVAKLAIVDGGLQVETKPLEIEYQGVRYDLGPFVIRVGRRGVVSIWSESPRHPGGVPHPHIAKDGGPCFGNATDAILKAGADHRYHDAVTLVLRWLKDGYSPQLASVKIEEWPKAGEDLSPEAAVERDNQAFAAAVEKAKEVSDAGA
jgi:hypothetical protein